MIEKITKYKKYIIFITIMLVLVILFMNIKYLLPKKYEELPEIKLREIKSSKSFAIMVQNGDGYEEYSSEDNNWPGSDYVYKEAKCTDNNGSLIENAITFASETKTVILETDKTVSCTLYFDEKPKTIEYLRTKDTQGYLSEDLQGGMYRYQAAPADETEAAQMTNWICFGTTENCGTSDDRIKKYMYRIIGITKEGEMKLIKETFVEEESVSKFAWNDEYDMYGEGTTACPNHTCPEWNGADLFKRINGTANGTIAGGGDTNDGVDNDTDIFVDSVQYEYLRSGDKVNGETASIWYTLISDHEWMYGDTETDTTDTATYDGYNVYQIETGQKETTHYVQKKEGEYWVTEETYKWPSTNKVNAKISLMYIHDYIYAYPDGTPGGYSTAKNAWIFYGKDSLNPSGNYEWLSTRWGPVTGGTFVVRARNVSSYGFVNYDFLNKNFGVRPVFYLESKAKIASGEGTKTDPFILSF